MILHYRHKEGDVRKDRIYEFSLEKLIFIIVNYSSIEKVRGLTLKQVFISFVCSCVSIFLRRSYCF